MTSGTNPSAGDPHSGHRYYLKIATIPQAVFAEIGGLQVETDVLSYEEGGNNAFVHKLPGRTKVGNLTLKRGLGAGNELWKWYASFVGGTIRREDATLEVYDSEGTLVAAWTFYKAFPVKWVGPTLNAASGAVAIETLELAHSGVKLD